MAFEENFAKLSTFSARIGGKGTKNTPWNDSLFQVVKTSLEAERP